MPQPPRPDRPRRKVKFEVSIDGVVPTHEELRRNHPDVVDLLPGVADQDRAAFDTPEAAKTFADAIERSREVVEVTYPLRVGPPTPEDTVVLAMTESQVREYERTLPDTYYLSGPFLVSADDDRPTYIVEIRP